MRKRSEVVMGLLVISIFVACGGVEHSLGGTEVRQKAEDGAKASSASQDAGGSPAVDGAAALPAAACGSCPDSVAYGNNFAGCCLPDGSCGVELGGTSNLAVSDDGTRSLPTGCQARDQVGVPDPTCPSLYSGNLAGCCRPDNTCGADVGILGLGCVQEVVTTPPRVYTGVDAGPPPPRVQLPPAPCTYSAH